jgi:putative membrane protein
MVTWFAGLFYLPRLFVYHAMSEDQVSRDRFKIMERKLYFGIATPGGILTILFGFWTMFYSGANIYAGQWWLYLKLVFVALLAVYHIYCGILLYNFKHDRNKHSHIWYRWLNEVPVIFLIGIILLAVLRPF